MLISAHEAPPPPSQTLSHGLSAVAPRRSPPHCLRRLARSVRAHVLISHCRRWRHFKRFRCRWRRAARCSPIFEGDRLAARGRLCRAFRRTRRRRHAASRHVAGVLPADSFSSADRLARFADKAAAAGGTTSRSVLRRFWPCRRAIATIGRSLFHRHASSLCRLRLMMRVRDACPISFLASASAVSFTPRRGRLCFILSPLLDIASGHASALLLRCKSGAGATISATGDAARRFAKRG